MRLPWRPLKIVALGLGLLVGLGLISWAVTNARATARVAEGIAALRAAGEPTTLADLRRKPIPPESNAMTYLDQAAPAVKAMVSAVFAVEEQATEEERKAVGDNGPSPAILAAMRDALAAHPDVMPLFERAAACPDFDWQWDFNLTSQSFMESMLTERFSALRNVWRVLGYQAHVQLADGRRDDALRTCLTMLKLTRLPHHEPCVVNFLVGMAVRSHSIRVTEQVLASGPVSPELHAELEAELARQDLAAAYRESLRSERAFGNDCFRDIGMPYHFQSLFKNDHCDYLDLIAFAIATSDRTLSDAHVRDELARVSREAGSLTRLIVSAIDGARESRFRNETLLHTLRVLNAIQAREQAGDESEPQLDKLGLPVEATLDPVNGDPLQIRRTPQGWLIYGVGANLTDDGGQLEDDLDVGVGPSEITPKD
jgi:hypothetical protein